MRTLILFLNCLIVASAYHYHYADDAYRYPSLNVRLQRYRDAAELKNEFEDAPLKRKSHYMSNYERKYRDYLNAMEWRKRMADTRAKRFYQNKLKRKNAFNSPSEFVQERELSPIKPDEETQIIPESAHDVKERVEETKADTKPENSKDTEKIINKKDAEKPEVKVVEVIEKNLEKVKKDSVDKDEKVELKKKDEPIVKDVPTKEEKKDIPTKNEDELEEFDAKKVSMEKKLVPVKDVKDEKVHVKDEAIAAKETKDEKSATKKLKDEKLAMKKSDEEVVIKPEPEQELLKSDEKKEKQVMKNPLHKNEDEEMNPIQMNNFRFEGRMRPSRRYDEYHYEARRMRPNQRYDDSRYGNYRRRKYENLLSDDGNEEYF